MISGRKKNSLLTKQFYLDSGKKGGIFTAQNNLLLKILLFTAKKTIFQIPEKIWAIIIYYSFVIVSFFSFEFVKIQISWFGFDWLVAADVLVVVVVFGVEKEIRCFIVGRDDSPNAFGRIVKTHDQRQFVCQLVYLHWSNLRHDTGELQEKAHKQTKQWINTFVFKWTTHP